MTHYPLLVAVITEQEAEIRALQAETKRLWIMLLMAAHDKYPESPWWRGEYLRHLATRCKEQQDA